MLFLLRHIDRRNCYQLSSTVATLSHCASTFVYSTLSVMQCVTRLVCDSWSLLFHIIAWPTFVAYLSPLCLEWYNGSWTHSREAWQ